MQRSVAIWLLVCLWGSLVFLVSIAIYVTPPSRSSNLVDVTFAADGSADIHRALSSSSSLEVEAACTETLLGRGEGYKPPLLPAIVIISSSPTTSATDTLMAARAVVLNSFVGSADSGVLLLERLLLLDASGQLAAAERGGGTSASAATDMAMLRSELALRWKAASGAAKAATLGAAGQRGGVVEVFGDASGGSAGLRSDETAFRASVETYLWQLVDGAPRAVVWLLRCTPA